MYNERVCVCVAYVDVQLEDRIARHVNARPITLPPPAIQSTPSGWAMVIGHTPYTHFTPTLKKLLESLQLQRTTVSGTTQPRCWCVWSTFSALLWHQPSRRTTLQTFYGRQPSFSGCCRQDRERTAGQSRFNDVTTNFPAPSEDISVSAFFFLALQWTWQ